MSTTCFSVSARRDPVVQLIPAPHDPTSLPTDHHGADIGKETVRIRFDQLCAE